MTKKYDNANRSFSNKAQFSMHDWVLTLEGNERS